MQEASQNCRVFAVAEVVGLYRDVGGGPEDAPSALEKVCVVKNVLRFVGAVGVEERGLSVGIVPVALKQGALGVKKRYYVLVCLLNEVMGYRRVL